MAEEVFLTVSNVYLDRASNEVIRFKIIYLAFSVLIIFTSESLAEEISGELDEEFTEALLLRPLPDHKVLAHFHFQSNLPPTRKSNLWPPPPSLPQNHLSLGSQIPNLRNGVIIHTRSLEL